MLKRVRVRLSISADELMAYYEGQIKFVVAYTQDGRTVKFPANILRKVVEHNGVQGVFELSFDENNKFVSIVRLGD